MWGRKNSVAQIRHVLSGHAPFPPSSLCLPSIKNAFRDALPASVSIYIISWPANQRFWSRLLPVAKARAAQSPSAHSIQTGRATYAIIAAPCLKPACQLRLIVLAPACMRFRNTYNLHVPNYRQMGSEKTLCTRACIALVGAGKESCYVATFIQACLLRFCSLISSQTTIRHAHAHTHTHTHTRTHTPKRLPQSNTSCLAWKAGWNPCLGGARICHGKWPNNPPERRGCGKPILW